MREFVRHATGIPLEIIREGSDRPSMKILQNISLGGLSCQYDEYLDIGTQVKVRITAIKPVFEVSGKVAWCRKIDDQYEIGIEYQGEKDLFRLRMVEQISHIEHYRKEILESEGRQLTGEEAAQEWIDKYSSDFP